MKKAVLGWDGLLASYGLLCIPQRRSCFPGRRVGAGTIPTCIPSFSTTRRRLVRTRMFNSALYIMLYTYSTKKPPGCGRLLVALYGLLLLPDPPTDKFPVNNNDKGDNSQKDDG